MEKDWHYLKSVKGTTLPGRTLFVQVEGREEQIDDHRFQHSFRLAHCASVTWRNGLVLDVKEKGCLDARSVFDWLDSNLSRDRSTMVFSHGLGYVLSLLGFWDLLNRGRVEYVFGVLEDPPTILVTRWGRRVMKWVDVINYWPCPLHELRGRVKLEDLKRPAREAPDSDWAFYCRRKTFVVRDLICSTIRLLHSTQMCGLGLTAASMSWECFRKSFCRPSPLIHGDLGASNLERASLFGGRLILRATGHVKKPTCAVDVNSLYPYMMQKHEHPQSLVSYQPTSTIREFHDAVRGYFCVGEVCLEVPCPSLPHRNNGLVSYAGQSGWHVLCGPDLAMAARNGMVCAVGRLARYRTADLFSSFVRTLYPEKSRAKREGRQADALFWKMILCGLSGKWGQQARGWVDRPAVPCSDWFGTFYRVDLQTSSLKRYRAVAGMAQEFQIGGETYHSFPAITASITCWGRAFLSSLTYLVGEKYVWYEDTDSLHLLHERLSAIREKEMLDPYELGKLKLVCSGPDAYYWHAKHYRVGDHWVSNVIQANAQAVADGIYLQQTRTGIGKTLASDDRSHVTYSSQQITVRTGIGAYRPTPELRT